MSSLLRSRLVQEPYKLFHYHFLLEKEPGNSLADLTFDTDVNTSISKIKRHPWTANDIAHYAFLVLVIAFVYVIFPASFLVKTAILTAFVLCFLVPLTSQFFVHALPIFSWLALFFSASKIPVEWKPAISVKFLPAMETILYGDNLLNVLAATNNWVLDIAAWLPYGLIHFVLPFVVALMVFLFAPPKSLRSFGFAFGYMNLAGVLVQLLFPAAAPWYKNLHGLEPANYGMNGAAGGLARIDALLGVDMYTTTFKNSPLVFGAFPSLHSGCAVMDVLFLCWLFPRFKFVWWGYALILWWSTMYLTHHYFIDLIFGAALSYVVFTYTRYTQLPIVYADKFCRWLYTLIDLIDTHKQDPLGAFIPVADEESLTGNLPYSFFNAPSLSNSNFEMTAMARSRESFRSHSSLQLAETTLDHLEGDTDNSTTNSVFDGEEAHISLATSNTSLSDLVQTQQAALKKSAQGLKVPRGST